MNTLLLTCCFATTCRRQRKEINERPRLYTIAVKAQYTALSQTKEKKWIRYIKRHKRLRRSPGVARVR